LPEDTSANGIQGIFYIAKLKINILFFTLGFSPINEKILLAR